MTDSQKMLRKLIVSAILTLIPVYLSMGNVYFDLPVPEVIRNSQMLMFLAPKSTK